MKCKHFTCHSCQDPEVAELVRERDEAQARVIDAALIHAELVRERDEARAELAGLPAWQKGCEQALGDLADAEEAIARLYTERDEARAEVERLKAQRLERHLESWEQYMQDNDVKRAFRRGAEAMREVCAQWIPHLLCTVDCDPEESMRALPFPEEP